MPSIHLWRILLSSIFLITWRGVAGEEVLDFCFGDGSICGIGNDLYSQCDAYNSDFEHLTNWYKCLCSNGYVAVDEACYYCQLVYNLDISYAGNTLHEGCSSAGVPIAPIPSSVLSSESYYNATYTGPPPPGQTSGRHSSPGSTSATVTTTDTDFFPTSSSSSPVNSGVRSSLFAGSTAVTTFNGGAPATTSEAAPSLQDTSSTTAAQAATSTGRAATNRVGDVIRRGGLGLAIGFVAVW